MSRARRVHARSLALLSTFPLVAIALMSAGCSPRVDVKAALEVTDVVTGWYDAGIVAGQKNKLVPSVTFRVKNVSTDTITLVQFNAVFRVVDDPQELGSKLVRGIGTEGLAAGQSVGPYTLQSDLGYTGEQPRAQMLQHGQFKDAKVEIFAKHGSAQWVKLVEHAITRQLLAAQ